MHKILMIIVLSAITFSMQAQEEKAGVDFFHGSWNEVLAASKETGKPIFVDAFAVWCGPCKWMNRTTFLDAEVGEFYNDNFINYKFDMEKGEGRNFKNEYHINAYPTLLYLNANGEVKHRVMGAQPGVTFISTGKEALKRFED